MDHLPLHLLLFPGRTIVRGREPSVPPGWFLRWRLRHAARLRNLHLLSVYAAFAILGSLGHAEEPTRITVQTAKVRQVFEGLGAGAIFYEAHITSLAERNKNERQEQLYDDMFARVPTRYL